ncbi:MAG TPA: AAA family ATPase [Rhodopseudomonas sp.]|uniref:AAA family ATPase n=1 Tax=Rhodopseudomonas sp. TaxID=1078 RepID=UPI002EDB54CA
MAHRESETQELLRLLDAGHSIQMLAPRRVGKTWLMHDVERRLKAQGWLTIFSDVEGMSTEDEFLRDLCKKIEEAGSLAQRAKGQLVHRLQQLLTSDIDGNPIKAIGHIDVKRFSEALVASLNEQPANVVILVDEIALFVAARLAADPTATLEFLYHLRKLRQAYPKVRWLLTGSIGLDVVARRAGLSGSLVDLEIFPLDPFSKPEARAYLAELCKNGKVRWRFALDDNGFDHLAEQLGWLSPFYLHLIANRIKSEAIDGGVPFATIAEIDCAFEQLLAPAYRGSFAAWEEHLTKNFPKPESDILHAILESCAGHPAGETVATLLTKLTQQHPAISQRALMDSLTALANDGFLIEATGRWQFRSGLLRRYWQKYICP